MLQITSGVVFLFFSLLLPLFLKAQDEAQLYYDEGQKELLNGNYEKAISYFKAAAQKFKQYFPDSLNKEFYIRSINQMAQGMVAIGNTEEAISNLEKNLSEAEQLNVSKSALSEVYMQLGLAYDYADQYDKAIQYFRHAISLRQSFLGQDKIDGELATIYLYIGRALDNKGLFDDAISFKQKALHFFELPQAQEQYPGALGNCKTNLGASYSKKNDLTRALALYEEAIELKRKDFGEESLDLASTYNNIGLLYIKKSDYTKAVEYFNKALAIWQKRLSENHPYLITLYNNLGQAYFELQENEQAKQYIEKALRLATAGNEPTVQAANAYRSQGNLYFDAQDWQNALLAYQKALDIQVELYGDAHPEVANTYTNIANIYAEQKDTLQSRKYYRKAIQIFEEYYKGVYSPDLARAYLLMGRNYTLSGQWKQAFQYIQRAIKNVVVGFNTSSAEQNPPIPPKLDSTIIDPAMLLECLETKAEIHFKQSARANPARRGQRAQHMPNLEKALATFQTAVSLVQSMRKSEFSEEANTRLSQRFFSVLEKAMRYAHQYESFRKLDIWEEATLKVLEDTAARAIFQDTLALEQLIKALSHQYHLDTYNQRALKALFLELARQRNLQPSNIYNNNLPYKIDSYITNYFNEPTLVSKLLEPSSYYKDIFYFSEQSKAASLLNALYQANPQNFRGVPSEIIKLDKELRVSLAGYKKNLAEEKAKGKKAKTDKIQLWQEKIFLLSLRQDSLYKVLEKQYPDFFQLQYDPQGIKVEQLQKRIRKDAAVVEYFVGDSALFIIVVTKKEYYVFQQPALPRLNEMVRSLRNDMILQDKRQFLNSATLLYNYLFAPIEEVVANINYLIFIPDAMLNYVPFEVLLTQKPAPTDNYENLPYLIKKHKIYYSYSANLLFDENDPNKQRKTNLQSNIIGLIAPVDFGFKGDPKRMGITSLPGTEQEVKKIYAMFQQLRAALEDSLNTSSLETSREEEIRAILTQMPTPELFLRQQATEGAIDWNKYRILHFATHGLVNTERPELSSILLYKNTKEEDGALFYGEIFNINLNTDLVVLSACETALGKYIRGEGIAGLAQSLMYAGTTNVIVSLWEVSDESTAQLMINFYNGMARSNTKVRKLSPTDYAYLYANLLQRAKLSMIHGAKNAAPFYWAPFILLGS
ncbi:MAG: tetratricopeptide repeat protein [Bacteroidia bacterium]|nr:tetratricopeptide repeat protein [Bacteroidia bacterium]MDW8158589.1 tetratricopeptide repeat protein [Bacteroidia bacterium]